MKKNGFKLDENGSSEAWKQEQLEKLKNEKKYLLDKISSDDSEIKTLEGSIGSLSNKISGLETNIRNISSAIKTLTLGTY